VIDSPCHLECLANNPSSFLFPSPPIKSESLKISRAEEYEKTDGENDVKRRGASASFMHLRPGPALEKRPD
jgi:hypothetical protein